MPVSQMTNAACDPLLGKCLIYLPTSIVKEKIGHISMNFFHPRAQPAFPVTSVLLRGFTLKRGWRVFFQLIFMRLGFMASALGRYRRRTPWRNTALTCSRSTMSDRVKLRW